MLCFLSFGFFFQCMCVWGSENWDCWRLWCVLNMIRQLRDCTRFKQHFFVWVEILSNQTKNSPVHLKILQMNLNRQNRKVNLKFKKKKQKKKKNNQDEEKKRKKLERKCNWNDEKKQHIRRRWPLWMAIACGHLHTRPWGLLYTLTHALTDTHTHTHTHTHIQSQGIFSTSESGTFFVFFVVWLEV